MQRCVIVGGAEIHDYQWIREKLRPDDFFIFCDSGLRHLDGLGVQPDLIIGDFDSHENPHLAVETIVLPRKKDDTDTVFAAREALRRGFESFLLIGAIGGRLDHTLVNVSILTKLRELGKKGMIADDYSTMEMIGAEPVRISGDCGYFSLVNITGVAEDVMITGAKFPLEHGVIACSYQYATSNEVLPGKTAAVSVGRGQLLLIRIYRDSAK